jgi:cytochrome c oxidase subunit II
MTTLRNSLARGRNWLSRGIGAGALLAALIPLGPALADQPRPWQLSHQTSASGLMDQLIVLHDYVLLPLITIISLFVLALMAYCIFKFNAKAHPTPSKTTHNTLIEVAWTVIPIMILVGIAIPSFKLLYAQNRPPAIDMTLKAVGNQWYWTYVYPDHGDMSFDANMIPTDQLKPGQPRLLATDNEIVLPVGKNIRLLTTATDVIHAWTVPAFGVKVDAVPGRINEQWFNIQRPGTYYGQCSELCGIRHGFMPIQVKAVTPAEFDAWVKTKKAELGQGDTKFAKLQQ